MEVEKKRTQLPAKEEFRTKVVALQKKMEKLPGAFSGEALDKALPLKHSFADGCYIREISMPRGTRVISKIHKITHPYFVLKGKASILTENGVVFIEAPCHGITQAGTQRVLLIHEDMVWVTVHVTNKTDLKEIEEEIIAKDFTDLDSFINKDIIDIEKEEN